MHLRHLQLVDDKSVACCQEAYCKLIVSTCYSVIHKLAACCNKCANDNFDFNKIDNFVASCKIDKVNNFQQVCDVFQLCILAYSNLFECKCCAILIL